MPKQKRVRGDALNLDRSRSGGYSSHPKICLPLSMHTHTAEEEEEEEVEVEKAEDSRRRTREKKKKKERKGGRERKEGKLFLVHLPSSNSAHQQRHMKCSGMCTYSLVQLPQRQIQFIVVVVLFFTLKQNRMFR